MLLVLKKKKIISKSLTSIIIIIWNHIQWYRFCFSNHSFFFCFSNHSFFFFKSQFILLSFSNHKSFFFLFQPILSSFFFKSQLIVFFFFFKSFFFLFQNFPTLARRHCRVPSPAVSRRSFARPVDLHLRDAHAARPRRDVWPVRDCERPARPVLLLDVLRARNDVQLYRAPGAAERAGGRVAPARSLPKLCGACGQRGQRALAALDHCDARQVESVWRIDVWLRLNVIWSDWCLIVFECDLKRLMFDCVWIWFESIDVWLCLNLI